MAIPPKRLQASKGPATERKEQDEDDDVNYWTKVASFSSSLSFAPGIIQSYEA